MTGAPLRAIPDGFDADTLAETDSRLESLEEEQKVRIGRGRPVPPGGGAVCALTGGAMGIAAISNP